MPLTIHARGQHSLPCDHDSEDEHLALAERLLYSSSHQGGSDNDKDTLAPGLHLRPGTCDPPRPPQLLPASATGDGVSEAEEEDYADVLREAEDAEAIDLAMVRMYRAHRHRMRRRARREAKQRRLRAAQKVQWDALR